ncbi:MAG: uracil-DNA glycosylase [Planctomycetes bacterium]|nr:uracil-DNA glycosylase [Planctomycetota bacterium]
MTHPARALYSTLKYWRSAGLSQMEIIRPVEESLPQESYEDLRLKELEQEKELCLSCEQCELSQTRQKAIYGEGALNAKIMFIGSSPDEMDEKAESFLQGEVGELMDRMIAKMGFVREELYLCPIVKCRPPSDRSPSGEEANHCRKFIEKQIEIIKPKIICTLGTLASNYLLEINHSITDIRGKMQVWKGIPVMPTFHPAYLLKKKAARHIVWEDMLVIIEYISKVTKE